MSFARLRERRLRRNASAGVKQGLAVVELAVTLPLLAFLFAITIDFARVYYFSVTLTNCARAGAIYASDPSTADESPYASIQAAALSDATNLSPSPSITSSTGTDAAGRPVVSVTAGYTFRSMTRFPGIPAEIALQRTVTMSRNASVPN